MTNDIDWKVEIEDWTDLIGARRMQLAIRAGYLFSAVDSWQSDSENRDRFLNLELPEAWGEPFALQGNRGKNVFFGVQTGGIVATIQVSVHLSNVSIVLQGATMAAVEAFIEEFKELLPPTERKEDDKTVTMNYWSYNRTKDGGNHFSRIINVPTWESIEANYPSGTRSDLERFINMEPENYARHGRLMLWHGPPGTGKTYAIRSLASTLRDRLSVHVVVDPEDLLSFPAYMLQVALAMEAVKPQLFAEDDDEPAVKLVERWNLLVLEDTGELMGIESKQRTGQALSRLLNICDGLIGQSLNVLVLITTNEDVGKMHPAVVRPGRCMMNTEFPKFNRDAATDWLMKAGHFEAAHGSMTLAEMYAALEGRPYDEGTGVGFS